MQVNDYHRKGCYHPSMELLPPNRRRPRRTANPAEVTALRAEIARLRSANESLRRSLSDMEQAALHDALTGLYNRRYFVSAVTERIARVSRYSEQIAVVFVDVDELKSLNDQLGHGAGDAALKAISACLVSEVRESDVVARIGGDEFAVVIDYIEHSSALAKAAQLKLHVSAAKFEHLGNQIQLSAAFGVAMIAASDTPDELLRRASAAMYVAKREVDDISGRPPDP